MHSTSSHPINIQTRVFCCTSRLTALGLVDSPVRWDDGLGELVLRNMSYVPAESGVGSYIETVCIIPIGLRAFPKTALNDDFI